MALQIRRGTDAERQSITPSEGELIYATDTNQLFVGGKISPSPTLAQGGILVSGALVNDTDPTLSSDMDLNGNNITGTGNININGTITATGNINLGDAVDDNVIVGGQIGSSLIPNADGNYDLGAPSGAWKDVYAVAINVETTASVGDLEVSNSIISPDSSVIYDATTSSLNIANANITGNIDVGGNIVSGSTVVYSGVTGDLTAANIFSTGDLDVTGNVTIGQINTGDITSTGDIVAATGNITSDSVTTNSMAAGDGILQVAGSVEITDNVEVGGILTAAGILTNSIESDLTGSVFGDDSTLIVDGINNSISPTSVDFIGDGYLTTTGDRINIGFSNSTENIIIAQWNPQPGITARYYGITNGDTGQEVVINSSRGTLEAPVAIQAGDILHAQYFAAYEDTSADYTSSTAVIHYLDPNATVSGTNVPGAIAFITVPDGDPNNTSNALTLDSQGLVSVGRDLAQARATLDIGGAMALQVLTSAPSTPVDGMIAIADGATWNPLSNGVKSMVVYLDSGWREIAVGV